MSRTHHRQSCAASEIEDFELQAELSPAPFVSVDQLLEAADQMFRARRAISTKGSRQEEESIGAQAAADDYTAWFRKSFQLTPESMPIRSTCAEHNLNEYECEVLLALILERLGLLMEPINKCSDLLKLLRFPVSEKLKVLRSLLPNGRLIQQGLVRYEDKHEDDISDAGLIVNPGLLDAVLWGPGASGRSGVTSEDDLYRQLRSLNQNLCRRVLAYSRMEWGYSNSRAYSKLDYRITTTWHTMLQALTEHPDWKLNTLLGSLGQPRCLPDTLILLVLVGKQLRHLPPDHELFTGEGLVQAASESYEEIPENYDSLKSSGILITQGLIQPVDGQDALLTDDPTVLAKTEFELAGKALDMLGLDKTAENRTRRGPGIREPMTRLDQLVLSAKVREAIQMSIAHARHATRLIQDWGLGQTIHYGRAVTLLFSGPPGVGKSACAEAIAHELGKPILMADYSEIQNCFVGGTEKNIVKIFRQARRNGAVLFWDEADAMFYDRDDGVRTWEVRNVNVLLQELERFEGVCILTTNRKGCLDKALERRITLKVHFERPDRAMRRRIWQCLIPGKMPLSPDVDLNALGEAELTGGEIKNVILNAARLVLSRNDDTMIAMRDFEQAIEMECGGRLDRGDKPLIGFTWKA